MITCEVGAWVKGRIEVPTRAVMRVDTEVSLRYVVHTECLREDGHNSYFDGFYTDDYSAACREFADRRNKFELGEGAEIWRHTDVVAWVVSKRDKERANG